MCEQVIAIGQAEIIGLTLVLLIGLLIALVGFVRLFSRPRTATATVSQRKDTQKQPAPAIHQDSRAGIRAAIASALSAREIAQLKAGRATVKYFQAPNGAYHFTVYQNGRIYIRK